jgi:hypothetical protein
MLAHTYARMGNPGEARRLLGELEGPATQTYVSPYQIAVVHAALGETDRAMARLRQAHEQRSTDLVYIQVDPKLARLRTDPRFVELLRSMNLSP